MWIIRIISSPILLIPIYGQIIHIIHIYFLIKTLKPIWLIKIISFTNILNSSLSDIIRVHPRYPCSIKRKSVFDKKKIRIQSAISAFDIRISVFFSVICGRKERRVSLVGNNPQNLRAEDISLQIILSFTEKRLPLRRSKTITVFCN